MDRGGGFMRKQIVACDIETTGLNHMTESVLGVGYYKPGKSAFLKLEQTPPNLKDLVQVWHHGK